MARKEFRRNETARGWEHLFIPFSGLYLLIKGDFSKDRNSWHRLWSVSSSPFMVANSSATFMVANLGVWLFVNIASNSYFFIKDCIKGEFPISIQPNISLNSAVKTTDVVHQDPVVAVS